MISIGKYGTYEGSQSTSNQPLLCILIIRVATIQLPHDTIRITIFASLYDTYRDTFLTTLEP